MRLYHLPLIETAFENVDLHQGLIYTGKALGERPLFGSPVEAAWRSCGRHDNKGPRPGSGPSRYRSACTSCTSPAPPSDHGRMPGQTQVCLQ